ncbi:TPA: hypothetical protein ACVOZF_004548 [Vibrio diabolicus]
MKLSKSSDIPDELKEEYKRTEELVEGFLHWLSFCLLDTARDSDFVNNHLLSFLDQDIYETLIGVQSHVLEGIHNPPLRESRYLLELSMKVALIQSESYSSSIEDKLTQFNSDIKSTNISLMKKIDLRYLSEESKNTFYTEVGRLYGEVSNFVHVTPKSIEQRKLRVKAGRPMGKESPEDLCHLNDLLQRIYAVCLVFLSHSVPQYVVGDWHVDRTGELKKWYFLKSKYIAEIDSTLDYKHERQQNLEEIAKERISGVRF